MASASEPCRAVEFKNVDIVFGDEPPRALALIDQGATPRRDPRRDRRGPRRRRRASLDVERGRDLRADGPVGLGQVDAAARRQRAQQGRARQGAGRATATSMVDVATCDAGDAARASARSASRWCSSSSRCCRGARSRENVGFGLELARRAGSRAHASVVDEQLELVGLDAVGRANTRTSCPAACSSASASRAPSPPSADPAHGRAVLGARSADPRPSCRTSCWSCRRS